MFRFWFLNAVIGDVVVLVRRQNDCCHTVPVRTRGNLDLFFARRKLDSIGDVIGEE
jgi:hypothetical protein